MHQIILGPLATPPLSQGIDAISNGFLVTRRKWPEIYRAHDPLDNTEGLWTASGSEMILGQADSLSRVLQTLAAQGSRHSRQLQQND